MAGRIFINSVMNMMPVDATMNSNFSILKVTGAVMCEVRAYSSAIMTLYIVTCGK